MIFAAPEPEPCGDGHFNPKQRGALSFALLAVVRLHGKQAISTILTSAGSRALDYEIDGTGGDCLHSFGKGHADGVYVLEGRYVGSGEDVEFDYSLRELNEDEREHISANGEMEGIAHAWLVGWEDVECRECGKLGKDHGYLLVCP